MLHNSAVNGGRVATSFTAFAAGLMLTSNCVATSTEEAIAAYAERCVLLVRQEDAERQKRSKLSPRKYLWEGRDPLEIPNPPIEFEVGSVGRVPKIRVLAAGDPALVERPGVDLATYRPPAPRQGTFGGRGLSSRIAQTSTPIRVEFWLAGQADLLNGKNLQTDELHWASGTKSGKLVVEPLPQGAIEQLRAAVFELQSRNWKSADGKFSKEAVLAGCRRRGAQVALVDAEGKRATVKVDLLCDEDREYVRQWRMKYDPALEHLRD